MKNHSWLGLTLCACAPLLVMCKGADMTTVAAGGSAGTAGIASSAGAAMGGGAGFIASAGGGSTSGGAGGTQPSVAGTSGGGSAGDSAGAGGASSSSVSLRGACLTYAVASCKKDHNCEGMSGQDCYNSLPDDCPDVVLSPGSTRTPEILRACPDEVKAFPCDQWRLGFRPPCVTPGAHQAGEACIYASQCASLTCGRSDSTSCGHCLDPIPEGQPCAEFRYGCAPGLTCDGATCVTNVLTPAQEFVDPPPIAVDGVCTDSDRCVVGTYCVDPDGDSVGTCEKPAALDVPCKPALALDYEYCEYGLYCDAGHVCRALPTEGQACAVISSSSVCATGFTCNAQTNLCEAQLPLGSPCTDWKQCPENKCRSPGNDYDTCFQDPPVPGFPVSMYTDCICSRPRYEYQDCIAGIDTCDTGTECIDGKCTSVNLIGKFAEVCGAGN